MLQMELYKLLKRKLVLIILLGLFSYTLYVNVRDTSDPHRQYELEKYEAVKGILTDERLENFFENYEREEVDIFEDSFMKDGNLEKVSELYPNIDFDLHFGYFLVWIQRLVMFGKFMPYVTAFVIITFSAVFTYEKECGMQEVLLSTKNGRRKCTRAKVAVAVLVTNSICLLALVLMLGPVFLLTKGIGWDTSVQMASSLRTVQIDVNYLTLVFHVCFLSVMAVNVVLLLTLLVSFLSNSPVVAMCITLIILLVLRPDMVGAHIGNVVMNRIVSLSPLNVVKITNLVDQEPIQLGSIKIHCLAIAEVIYPLILVMMGIILFRVVTRHQKYYAS